VVAGSHDPGRNRCCKQEARNYSSKIIDEFSNPMGVSLLRKAGYKPDEIKQYIKRKRTKVKQEGGPPAY
jgi:hypothetical protein